MLQVGGEKQKGDVRNMGPQPPYPVQQQDYPGLVRTPRGTHGLSFVDGSGRLCWHIVSCTLSLFTTAMPRASSLRSKSVVSLPVTVGGAFCVQESKMDPAPDYGYDDYRGSGKLQDQVALITGERSVIKRSVWRT